MFSRSSFLLGVSYLASAPALFLMTAFIGFAGFARESGFSLSETAFMTLAIWALPSKVVYVSAIADGATYSAVAVAVTLSAVRLLPMAATLIPVLKAQDTSRFQLVFLSHFIAITAWVVAMTKLPDLPREERASFFAGFGMSLCLACTIVASLAFILIGTLPPLIAACLLFVMPLYFLVSLFGAARQHSDKLAMIVGLSVGPLFSMYFPGPATLFAGLFAGTVSFYAVRLYQRFRRV